MCKRVLKQEHQELRICYDLTIHQIKEASNLP